MRLIYAACISLLFLGRLDQPAVQRHWETLDAGYNCYLGYLAVEVANSHPGMIVFCKILLGKIGSNGKVGSNKRARNRWFLAKTLIFNPKLKYERKQYLKSLVPEEDFSVVDKAVEELDTESGCLSKCFSKSK